VARVYLGLGSNLPGRLGHLRVGLRELARHGVVEARSPIFETEPVDSAQGGRFLNACICLRTRHEPRQLLAESLQIERARGRRRRHRCEARVLDIDLLLVDQRIIRQSGLTVPHPRMHARAFVLHPLVTIAPRLVHPTSRFTIEELLARLPPGAAGALAARY